MKIDPLAIIAEILLWIGIAILLIIEIPKMFRP